MIQNVMVIVEHEGNKIKNISKEILTYFGSKKLENLKAFVYGKKLDEKLFQEIASYGIEEVVTYEDEKLNVHNPQLISEKIVELVEEEKPQLVIAGNTINFRDVFPSAAQYFKAEVFNDAINIEDKDGKVELTRPIYGGALTEKTEFEEGLIFVTVRPNSLGIKETEKVKTKVKKLKSKNNTIPKYLVKDTVDRTESDTPINEAEIIVAVGRGIRKKEDMKLAEDLADTVGAVVGSTRPVVDMGFVRRSHQIGQSGKSVSPKLVFTLGISGQIQFVAGIANAKRVVAVNKNKNATIFKTSDYGIVGDLYKIVPVLTEELEKLNSK